MVNKAPCIALLLLFALATCAFATHGSLSHRLSDPVEPKEKMVGTVDQQENRGPREPIIPQPPGDVIGDPFLIPSVPFSDTGYTCGFNDDYDEVCPFSNSQSHDVVYAYTPEDNESMSVSLCADSRYDTKLYVYENAHTPGAPFACNDDFCTTPSYPNPYVSELPSVSISAGNTYYIVVDGYGGENGYYTLDISN